MITLSHPKRIASGGGPQNGIGKNTQLQAHPIQARENKHEMVMQVRAILFGAFILVTH
jgi:hypothetical protein